MNSTKPLKNLAGFNSSPFNPDNPSGGNAIVGARFIGRLTVNNRPKNRAPTKHERSNELSGFNPTPLKGRDLFRSPLAVKISLLTALLIITPPSGADELGRLFFTPAQRAQLDHSYVREARPDNNNRALTLDGIVQKHGGKRTAWINGVPQQAGSSDDKTPESLPVTVPGQSKPVKIKVGQKVLINPAASSGQ